MDLKQFENQTFVGKIKEVREISLREYLEQRHGAKAPAVIEKFNEENIDRPHVVIIVSYETQEIDWFGMIPKSAQGWTRTNLYSMMNRNGLPANTDKWVGKDIELKLNSQGFLRVAV